MASRTEAPARTADRATGRRVRPLVATLPAVVWLLAFFATPLVVFLLYSFLTNELYAVGLPFTLDAYADALTSSLNRTLARNSLVVGLLTASVTVVVG
jgi:ABC-type spermidine/putrescine transport system permease subunit I